MDAYAIYANVQQQNNDDLLIQHAPLVKKIAYHIFAKLPDSVQIDDLIQAGMMGLLEAMGQFDPDNGANFKTYAGIRIRGSIFDEIRKNDWTPRSVSRNLREMSNAIASVEARKVGSATAQEIADELGVTLEKYQKMSGHASRARVFGLDDHDGGGEQAGLQEPDVIAMHDESPDQLVHNEGFKKSLVKTIKSLPEREQLVMSLYYEDELNLKEIGKVLDVTESRVSQIHGQALARIRQGMTDWTGE